MAIIPARLQSTRLPRKPLVDILGLPMIVHVYRRCLRAGLVDDVIVATDSDEVAETVVKLGGKVTMTSSHHRTGSDRITEVAASLDCEIVVNVQGDEALVCPEHIDAAVKALHDDPSLNIAILVNPFRKYESPSDIKVVLNARDDVMYLSRSDIPSSSRTLNAPMLKAYHVVPFRRPFLLEYQGWGPGFLEEIEFNEYLRILERGHRMHAVRVESSAVSVDTEEDLAFVREAMKSDALFPHYRDQSTAHK